MTPTYVAIFLVVVVVLFLAIDVKLAKDKVPGNTYSEIVRDTGNRWPAFRIVFIFAWGVLAGHWWW
jgi:hypothetical protein